MKEHMRWITPTVQNKLHEQSDCFLQFGDATEPCFSLRDASIMVSDLDRFHENHILTWENTPEYFSRHSHRMSDQWIGYGNQNAQVFSDEDIEHYTSGIKLTYLLGDVNAGAIYLYEDKAGITSYDTSVETINKSLQARCFDSNNLFLYLEGLFTSGSLDFHAASFKVLATAMEIYKLLPNATIALNVTSQPLHQMRWRAKDDGTNFMDPGSFSTFPDASPLLKLSRAQTFACIATFESGVLDIDPAGLGTVMAMSVENSIYIAGALLCDPCERSYAHEIRRVVGNIGRPGINMLIPPSNPKVQGINEESWNRVDHAAFDGELLNCFNGISLHLSFSEYIMPIDVRSHGGRDAEMYFVEALVSVHDRGEWIADLDVLGMLGKRHFPSECLSRMQS